MRIKNSRSISVKLFRAIFGFYCIAAVVITIFHLGYDYFSIREQMRQSILLYQNSLEKTLTKELWHLDRSKNRATLEGIAHLPFVVGASVHLPDGSLFNRVGLVATEEENSPVWDAETLDASILPRDFRADLFIHTFNLYDRDTQSGAEPIGHVHLYSSSAAIFQQLKSLSASIIVAALFKTSFLWIIFIVVMNRRLGRPLKELVDFVGELPIEPERHDAAEQDPTLDINELELLERTLEQMSRRLINTLEALRAESLRYQETAENLKQVNERIEARIRERTEDLQKSNSRLTEEVAARREAEAELAARNAELSAALQSIKQAQSTILQQEKMASIGQLAAGVAHEINNPMGFIISNLNTLGKYLAKLEEFGLFQQTAIRRAAEEKVVDMQRLHEEISAQRKHLKIDYLLEDIDDLIHESLDGSARVKEIVQNLKSFARIDEQEWKESDINEALESTLNIVWNELKYKATVRKEYGDIPPVMCNVGQLNQVFMNLLVNAAQAIEEKGEVLITTGVEGESLVIRISDNGCGIPEDKVNRIFEPFYTSKDVGKGTGLGLSIAFDIIKKHQGLIEVASRVGEGTTFSLHLPLHLEAAEEVMKA